VLQLLDLEFERVALLVQLIRLLVLGADRIVFGIYDLLAAVDFAEQIVLFCLDAISIRLFVDLGPEPPPPKDTG
jgi:hypothetical protein